VILSNPVYRGVIGWHKRPDRERKAHDFHETEWKQGEHEPLWTEALWESIQAVRRRAYRGSNGGKVHNTYPFRRLAVCDRCGANLYGEAHGAAKGRDPVLYMACITQRERHGCDQRAVRSAHLEDQAGAWLATLVIPDDWRADIERLQRREAQIERPVVDTARVERQLANLRDLFADADITREEYIGRKRALMASLNGGLPQPTYSEAVLVRAARLLSDLGELWAKATPTERAEVAAGLFAEIRVRDERIVAATLAHDDYLPLIASATARAQEGGAPGGRRARSNNNRARGGSAQLFGPDGTRDPVGRTTSLERLIEPEAGTVLGLAESWWSRCHDAGVAPRSSPSRIDSRRAVTRGQNIRFIGPATRRSGPCGVIVCCWRSTQPPSFGSIE
jgi:hypothetical protein